MPPSPSPDAASSSSPSSTASNDPHRHKGKLTRSWPQLPPELIRLIATHFLFDHAASAFVPHTWSIYGFWPGRAMYTTYQNAQEMDKLMKICPEWATAIEQHHFWNYACSMMDPHDFLLRHRFSQNNASSAVSTRHSTCYHFHYMALRSCHICRINHPDSNYGLLTAKRQIGSFTMGSIFVCKDHKRSTFCGVCLREQPSYAPDMAEALIHFGLSENEDFETWPDVAMTCRPCRSEWLWRHMSSNQSDRDAVGGGPPHWAALDVETRLTIDYFIENGEGTIKEVVLCARERHWLHEYTRMDDFLDEIVAAQRLGMRSGSNYDDEAMDQEVDNEMDEDEPPNAQAMAQVRDMAVTDWARTRILDGYWTTPADEWFKLRGPPYPARHPAPWSSETRDADPSHPTTHPNPEFHRLPTAPTHALAEFLHRAFQRQLRQVLTPAMHNVIKRLRWQARGDPAISAARMDVHDVLRELQQPYAWSKDLRAESLPPPPMERTKDDEGSSKSDTSHGSHTTSPVLSTTTLQTTPSPPPREDQEKEDATDTAFAEPASPIDMSGVVPPDPSNLLHTIPYVPVTLVDAPKFIVESITTIWREACMPLFQCRCRICERAAMASMAVSESIPPNVTTLRNPGVVPSQTAPQPQIRIEESDFQVMTDEEEDEDDEDEDGWSWGTSSDVEGLDAEGWDPKTVVRPAVGVETKAPRTVETPRRSESRGTVRQDVDKGVYASEVNGNGKRNVRHEEEEEEETRGEEDREEEEEEDQGTEGADALDGLRAAMGRRMSGSVVPMRKTTPPRTKTRSIPGTPPKRIRVEGTYSPVTVASVQQRLVKRPSEEATEDDVRKRPRVEIGKVSP